MGEVRVDGAVAGDGDEQADAVGGRQALRGVPERGPGGGVQEVRVVHADERRRLTRRRPQDGEEFTGGGPGAVRLPARCGTEHGTGSEGAGGPGEECGPAESGFPGHEERAATGGELVQQGAQYPALRAPAVDPRGRGNGRLSGHSREVTRA